MDDEDDDQREQENFTTTKFHYQDSLIFFVKIRRLPVKNCPVSIVIMSVTHSM